MVRDAVPGSGLVFIFVSFVQEFLEFGAFHAGGAIGGGDELACWGNQDRPLVAIGEVEPMTAELPEKSGASLSGCAS